MDFPFIGWLQRKYVTGHSKGRVEVGTGIDSSLNAQRKVTQQCRLRPSNFPLLQFLVELKFSADFMAGRRGISLTCKQVLLSDGNVESLKIPSEFGRPFALSFGVWRTLFLSHL